jgi:hypothetical protein
MVGLLLIISHLVSVHNWLMRYGHPGAARRFPLWHLPHGGFDRRRVLSSSLEKSEHQERSP